MEMSDFKHEIACEDGRISIQNTETEISTFVFTSLSPFIYQLKKPGGN